MIHIWDLSACRLCSLSFFVLLNVRRLLPDLDKNDLTRRLVPSQMLLQSFPSRLSLGCGGGTVGRSVGPQDKISYQFCYKIKLMSIMFYYYDPITPLCVEEQRCCCF